MQREMRMLILHGAPILLKILSEASALALGVALSDQYFTLCAHSSDVIACEPSSLAE